MSQSTGASPPASSVYDAVIDLPDESRLAHLANLAGQVLSAVIGDAGGVRGDVVVRRLADGEEVLRVDAGADEEPLAVLEQVRGDLDAMDAVAFIDKWSAVDEDEGEGSAHHRH